jgi:hypothetical protein
MIKTSNRKPTHLMKVGELYKVSHKWALSHDQKHFWSDCRTVIYLGPEAGRIGYDGPPVTNHRLLAKGQSKLVDSHFLRLLEGPLTNT